MGEGSRSSPPVKTPSCRWTCLTRTDKQRKLWIFQEEPPLSPVVHRESDKRLRDAFLPTVAMSLSLISTPRRWRWEMGADRCLFAGVNVADEAVEAGIDAAIEKFGAIYAVVNCAGIANASRTVGRDGAFPCSLGQGCRQFDRTFNVIRLCAVRMQHNEAVDQYMGRGVIINTASVAAYEGQMGQALTTLPRAASSG